MILWDEAAMGNGHHLDALDDEAAASTDKAGPSQPMPTAMLRITAAITAAVAIARQAWPSRAPANLERATLVPIARAHNISFGEFRRKFLATSTPVVVTGVMEEWEAGLLNHSGLDELCGDGPVFGFCGDRDLSQVKYHVRDLQSKWASLAVLPRDKAPLANISQLLAAQRNPNFTISTGQGPTPLSLSAWFEEPSRWWWQLAAMLMGLPRHVTGPELYLHDSPLHHHCPALLGKLRSPRYFPVNLLHQLGPGTASHRDQSCGPFSIKPSLFVGAASSRSGLHVDAHGTRFWMGVLRGTKTWRIVSPEAGADLRRRRPTPCDDIFFRLLRVHALELDPRVYSELCPGMGTDLFAGDDDRSADEDDDDGGKPPAPRTGPLEVWEATVSAGEIIFIPELWAHQVHNLDATLAISNNYVDDYSFGTYVRLADALLEFYKSVPKDAVDPAAMGSTARRLIKAGFARDGTPGFPWHSLHALPDNLLDSTWAAYAEDNAYRSAPGKPMSADEHDAAFRAWIDEGGATRFMDALKAERSTPW